MKKIAVHCSNGSFSKRWVEYLQKESIPFKVVDCYSTDIIEDLQDCWALLWHIDHMSHTDALFGKQLIHSLELSGIKVFPDIRTSWHFDDKIGQKYIFESLKIPFVKSYIFFSMGKALEWVKTTTFPKVFKLRGGAGSLNVMLVKSEFEAKKIIKKCFGKGFQPFNSRVVFKERLRKFLMGKASIFSVLKWLLAIFLGSRITKLHHIEIGYAYFQDFIPGNTFDIRIIVVGNKAFGIKRLVRNNDFRASGSGFIIYDKEQIPIQAVKTAFEANALLKCQSIAFDFVFDEANNPLIVEMSFGYAIEAYDNCEGYWDSELNWYQSKFNPQNWMIEDLILTKN